MTAVLMRGGSLDRDTQTEVRRLRGDRSREGMMLLQARQCQKPPEAGREAWDGFSL